MKKSLIIVTLTLLSSLGLHSASLAGSIQASATTRLLSDLRNPVEGTLAFEQSGARLGLSLGNNSRLSGSMDMLVRSKDGLYLGVGLTVDRLDDSDFYTTTNTDTTFAVGPHDHGEHKGDKHHRHGKTVTRITSSTTTVNIGGMDLDLSPAVLLGVSARRGLFVESRILFSGGDVNNRTSVGVRW